VKVLFNVPTVTGRERAYVDEVLRGVKFSGDGPFNGRCRSWLEGAIGCERAFLTPSCTAALELSALLLGIGPGDEVILPSFTFVSTANAFALRGAEIVFVDVDPGTMNMDPAELSAAISPRTRAIVVVHYGGVACEMDAIVELAAAHGCAVIEDAAQALGASYRGRPLGSIGALGSLSFHETKNVQCGEGGALLVNRPELVERAEILQEKGTNRCRFYRGEIDKYSWIDLGSSFLLGELSAAFLLAQLESVEEVTRRRLELCERYRSGLDSLVQAGTIEMLRAPPWAKSNGHICFLKTRDIDERAQLMAELRSHEISSVFHYVPLHSAEAGLRYGRFSGLDRHTTRDADRLLRLPLFHALEEEQVDWTIEKVRAFYGS